jgi:hypothetical protein
MKTTTTRFTLVAIFAAAMAMSSCQKEKTNPIVKKTSTDNSSIQLTNLIFNELVGIGDRTTGKTDGEPCKVVTRDMVSMPHTITIDYVAACQTVPGLIRSGQMIVSFDQNDFSVPGCNIGISFNNYVVNNKQITGGTVVTNNGYNGNGNLTFTFNANQTATDVNSHIGSTISSVETYEWLTGSSTLNDREDDTFIVTGSGSGTDAQGNNFTETIVTPLLKNRASTCVPYFVSGVVLNQTAGQSDRTTDYGNGTCDDQAEVTQDGVTTTITLHQ